MIHGSDELTDGIDVVPSTREQNLRRLGLALEEQPAGTRGYDDLRRRAVREPLGHGLRPSVASVDDHARMLAALDRDQDREPLFTIRRLIELEHELHRGLYIER